MSLMKATSLCCDTCGWHGNFCLAQPATARELRVAARRQGWGYRKTYVRGEQRWQDTCGFCNILRSCRVGNSEPVEGGEEYIEEVSRG